MPSKRVPRPGWSWPRAAVPVLAATLVAASAAGAAAPRVTVQVTGIGASRIVAPREVPASSFTTAIGTGAARRSCRVAQGTSLAALKALGVPLVIKDFGKCSPKAVDSASLFVDSIGGVAGTGIQGWSFKVNNRAATAGAADPNGAFGSGLLRNGDRILWFWCSYDPKTYACQGTLAVSAPSSVARGKAFTVSVREYDDAGRFRPAADAVVTVERIGQATTGSTGKTTFTAPGSKTTLTVTATDGRLLATGAGRPASFPVAIRVV